MYTEEVSGWRRNVFFVLEDITLCNGSYTQPIIIDGPEVTLDRMLKLNPITSGLPSPTLNYATGT